MHLEKLIHDAVLLLPVQGPISVFVSMNKLCAFENIHFEKGAQEGSRLYHCQPYLREDKYHELMSKGRILDRDIEKEVILDDGDNGSETVAGTTTINDIRFSMLKNRPLLAPLNELRWYIAETDALLKYNKDVPDQVKNNIIRETSQWVMRDIAPGIKGNSGEQTKVKQIIAEILQENRLEDLERWSNVQWETFTLKLTWKLCMQATLESGFKPVEVHPPVELSKLLFKVTNIDVESIFTPMLIKFCAAYLDQGMSNWQLPFREDGFFKSFTELYKHRSFLQTSWMRDLARELTKIEKSGESPICVINRILEEKGINSKYWGSYIQNSLLSLRGWAGMIWQIEQRGDRVLYPIKNNSLIEYLAVRLILTSVLVKHTARRRLGFQGNLSDLRSYLLSKYKPTYHVSVDQMAYLIFQVSQWVGWSPRQISEFSKLEWSETVNVIYAFDSLERRRLLHRAYERYLHTMIMDSVYHHQENTLKPVAKPKFQIVLCLDDREESLRRHLEEIEPEVETFGVAGFFNVPMYYQGAADAHFIPLCPIVMKPDHYVKEEVSYSLMDTHDKRKSFRRMIGKLNHQVYLRTRTVLGGALLSMLYGPIAIAPLLGGVLFPSATFRINEFFRRTIDVPNLTTLQLTRKSDLPGKEDTNLGFNQIEKANMTERMLRDIGLISSFSDLVYILGHGASSMNNPHLSAYDCGACGGQRGGPNARAFAQIANEKSVRDILRTRGIDIPDTTYFVGCFHNTTTEEVTYYDIDLIPKEYRILFQEIKSSILQACSSNAHEKSRRFESASLNMSIQDAIHHVKERSLDLAQVRAEYGHCTNALCFVGRRERTRGLFMDRRAFLTSYNPKQDDEQSSILARILTPVVPVCSGINLEYYFSHTDPTGLGSGTKLPHNVCSMVGVMDGVSSDLRIGLPWQAVEIHEPCKLLFIIETTREQIRKIFTNHPNIASMFYNGWVKLALLDPDSEQMHYFENNEFVEYQPEAKLIEKTSSSVNWYRGWRDNLQFASIVEDGINKTGKG